MLITALLVFIFLGVDLLISLLFTKMISKSTSATKSVQYRMIYRNIRICLIIIYSCIILCMFSLEIGYIYSMLSNCLIDKTYAEIRKFVIAFGIGLLPFIKYTLPVSSLTISSVKSNNYILLLRGFNVDDYSNYSFSRIYEIYLLIHQLISGELKASKSINDEELPISEFELYKAAKAKNLKFYSVGLPDELESPQGSTRIYLDNESWKEDVTTLILNAQCVFVIVNDRESCIWEISQCENIANEKTVYLIENEDIIKSTQARMKEMFPVSLKCYLQLVSNKDMRPHRRVYKKNGKIEIDHLANNRYGFATALNDVLFS